MKPMQEPGTSDFVPVPLSLVLAHGSWHRVYGAVLVGIAAAVFGLMMMLGPVTSWVGGLLTRLVIILIVGVGAEGSLALWRGLTIGLRGRGATGVEFYRGQFYFQRDGGMGGSASAARFNPVEAAQFVQLPEARVVRKPDERDGT